MTFGEDKQVQVDSGGGQRYLNPSISQFSAEIQFESANPGRFAIEQDMVEMRLCQCI